MVVHFSVDKYRYSVGNRATPLALSFEGLNNPFSISGEFVIGYNGTLAQTTAVDAWKFWLSGSTLTNPYQYNASQSGTDETNESSTGASNAGIFKNGDMLESNIITKNGTEIGALADVKINGTTLTLENVTVYAKGGDIKNQVGAKDFFQWQKNIAKQAKEQGFTTLVIKGERVAGSSSANPGKEVEYVIDLTKIK